MIAMGKMVAKILSEHGTPLNGDSVFDAIVLQCTALLTLLTSGGVPKLRGVSVISGIQASKSCGRGANP